MHKKYFCALLYNKVAHCVGVIIEFAKIKILNSTNSK